MRVIGTAGHVDHGKSALVQALTGIDPDRLKEEKERAMTIDLGFAWLKLPSGQEVSIVDVPGHEDFIKNMLAGVGGIDFALFVVAADEGVMPQTREHLAILDLLQVPDGVVALAKSDLIEDPEWLELVQEEVREELAGSVLEKAKIIPVSSVTGQGLSNLLSELDRLLQTPPPKHGTGRPRLPIDRVFTIAGFGTVITGTLIGGRLRVGQDVEILPRGLKARIRGLQTHKEKLDVAIPPSRVAVNLTGVSKEDLQRGDVLTTPGWLRCTSLLDTRLRLVKTAPRPLAHSAKVDFFTGAAQCQARVRVLDRKEVAPGEESWVQFVLADPVCVVKGDRFIIRQPSPSRTLGGGSIIDPFPGRQHRRFRPQVLQRLERLAHGTPEEVLQHELEAQQPREAATLVQRSALGREEAAQTLLSLLKDGQVVLLDTAVGQEADQVATSTKYVMLATGWQALLAKVVALLTDYHQRYPLRAGMPREELKSRLGLAPRAFNEALTRAASEGVLKETEAVVALVEHRVALSAEQQRRVERLLEAYQRSPYAPPSYSESEASVGADVLAALVEQGKLVKLSETVILSAEVYQDMRQTIVQYLQREGSITLAQVRDMFKTSRKYAQAVLEHLDDQRITRRVGDERVLR
ncbi:MAG: translation elongation factor [Anaerolineae bacterium SM23_84]|nr:MAG: translation elongation factor [Anaerolineae bacterium SM23_84]